MSWNNYNFPGEPEDIVKNEVKSFKNKEGFQVEVLQNSRQLEELRNDWDKLYEATADSSPFSSFSWVVTWCRLYSDKEKLWIIVVRKGNEVVGIAPLYLTKRYGMKALQLIGLKEVRAEGQHFIIKSGMEKMVTALILDALVDFDNHWDAVSFYGIRANSEFQNQLFLYDNKFLKKTTTLTTVIGSVPMIFTGGGWDKYLQKSSSNFRNNYKRHMSHAEEAGIHVINESEIDNHDDVVARLVNMEARSWQGRKGTGKIAPNKEFFKIIFPTLLDKGEVEIFWALNKEKALAFSVFLIHRNIAVLFATGYDVSLKKELPVGNLVNYAAVKKLSGNGVKVIDMMTDIGANQWKKRWTKDYAASLKYVFLKKNLRGKLIALTQI